MVGNGTSIYVAVVSSALFKYYTPLIDVGRRLLCSPCGVTCALLCSIDSKDAQPFYSCQQEEASQLLSVLPYRSPPRHHWLVEFRDVSLHAAFRPSVRPLIHICPTPFIGSFPLATQIAKETPSSTLVAIFDAAQTHQDETFIMWGYHGVS